MHAVVSHASLEPADMRAEGICSICVCSLCLCRLRTLTSFVLLIPVEASVLRVILAIVLEVSYLTLLLTAKPYKRASDNTTAWAVNFVMIFAFIAALLLELFASLEILVGAEQTDAVLGLRSAFAPALVIIVITLTGAASAALVIMLNFYANASTKVIRIRNAGLPDLCLDLGQRYHLFLSHTWASGQGPYTQFQTQMPTELTPRHVPRRQLTCDYCGVPGRPSQCHQACAHIDATVSADLPRRKCKCMHQTNPACGRMCDTLVGALQRFAQVDDLEDISQLEQSIAASRHILIFISKGYFRSRACRHELAAAKAHCKPLILVHEPDPKNGGVPLDESLIDSCPREVWLTARRRIGGVRAYIFGSGSSSTDWSNSLQQYSKLARSIPYFRSQALQQVRDNT